MEKLRKSSSREKGSSIFVIILIVIDGLIFLMAAFSDYFPVFCAFFLPRERESELVREEDDAAPDLVTWEERCGQL